MQREIASVMAACAMRGIRYIAFPPVVFEARAAAPLPEAPPEPEITGAPPPPPEAMAPEASSLPVEALILAESPAPLPAPLAAAAAPPALPPAPPVIQALPIEIAQPAVIAPPKPPGTAMRRLAELAAEATARPPRAPPAPAANTSSPTEPPAEAAPPRRYALLNDIAGQLPARRTRARAGKRA